MSSLYHLIFHTALLNFVRKPVKVLKLLLVTLKDEACDVLHQNFLIYYAIKNYLGVIKWQITLLTLTLQVGHHRLNLSVRINYVSIMVIRYRY